MTTRTKEPKAAATAGNHGFSLISDAKLFQLYTTMVKCRMIEERARLLLILNKVQRKLRGDGAAIGQEASAVGVAIDLLPEDTAVPSPRDRIVNFITGAPLSKIFESLLARASKPDLAAQLDRAIGAALASKTRKNGRISVVFGSGVDASSRLWQEALHVAGVHQLPILFVCPSSLATELAHRNDDAEQIAGFPVIPVDGNDAVAVYRVATEAIAHARKGNGATLIACHFSRSKAHDPIAQMEAYLKRKRLFQEGLKREAAAGFAKQLDSACAAAAAPTIPIRSSGGSKPA